MSPEFINIAVGASLLLFGRRLFWLFVAGAGFLAGATLATDWLGAKAGPVTVLIGLAAGILGAVLSLFLQRAAVAVAGFLSGGYLLYTLALGSQHASLAWIAFLTGGVLGAILVVATFDWALIGLSALTGATVISGNIVLEPFLSTLLFFGLLILGVGVQAAQWTRATRPQPK
jgi:hypothetical protein